MDYKFPRSNKAKYLVELDRKPKKLRHKNP